MDCEVDVVLQIKTDPELTDKLMRLADLLNIDIEEVIRRALSDSVSEAPTLNSNTEDAS